MNLFHRWFCRSQSWQRALHDMLPWVLDGVRLGDSLLEIGPGPGLTTQMLQERGGRLTCVEIDADLAKVLRSRIGDSETVAIRGDATQLPFVDGSFSGAVCFTMLHHVPSARLQDRLLQEVRRVLEPGGWLAGCDSMWSRRFHLIHLFDTMVIVDPDGFARRLEEAGFEAVSIATNERSFRFRCRRPASL